MTDFRAWSTSGEGGGRGDRTPPFGPWPRPLRSPTGSSGAGNERFGRLVPEPPFRCGFPGRGRSLSLEGAEALFRKVEAQGWAEAGDAKGRGGPFGVSLGSDTALPRMTVEKFLNRSVPQFPHLSTARIKLTACQTRLPGTSLVLHRRRWFVPVPKEPSVPQ